MADVTKEQVVEFLSNMSVLELTTLVTDLEEKWDVKAAAGGAMMMAAPGAVAGGAEDEEQTEFNVMLTSWGEKKVTVIKAVREVTGLGLKEAKDVVESLSVVKEGVSKEEAADIKTKLEAAGAAVEVK